MFNRVRPLVSSCDFGEFVFESRILSLYGHGGKADKRNINRFIHFSCLALFNLANTSSLITPIIYAPSPTLDNGLQLLNVICIDSIAYAPSAEHSWLYVVHVA